MVIQVFPVYQAVALLYIQPQGFSRQHNTVEALYNGHIYTYRYFFQGIQK